MIRNELIPITQIDPHPRNYQMHGDDQLHSLAVSHTRFGQYRSLVLWARPDGRYVTVAGHGILEAMRANCVRDVRADVLPEDTPPDTIEGILIADNETARMSTLDEEVLARLLQEQQEAGYDLVSMGSDEDALHDLLMKYTPPNLDELTAKYGDDVDEDAFWPIIRIKVSPETKERYDVLMEDADGESEAERFAWLLEQVNGTFEDEEEE